MKRLRISPRNSWQQIVESQGCRFHTMKQEKGLCTTYWDESVYYEFTVQQIGQLERATNTLHQLCIEACQHVIDNNRFAELGLTEYQAEAITETWYSEPPSVYGRFDLAYDGVNPPKMLEYNANTPTSLIETARLQVQWRQEVFPGRVDPLNSLEDKLVSKWNDIKDFMDRRLHLTSMPNLEDTDTALYMGELAKRAGFETKYIRIRDIGYNASSQQFRDLDDLPIRSLFSLYPWEWFYKDFGPTLTEQIKGGTWIEPAWKILLSNKGLMAVLWELHPRHENLLSTHIGSPHIFDFQYVKKPLISREGANVTVHRFLEESTTPGPYGSEGFIYQEIAPIPVIDGKFPVLGSWYVTDFGAAGFGIRESDQLVTNNASRFVPHVVTDATA